MKQTVSIPAADINVVSKPSAISTWLKSKNQLFSWVLEESSVTNRQVLLMAHASLAFSAMVGAYHVYAILTLVCLAWFIVSLYLCVKGGLK